jgi:predicted DNA binding CopG/RHH family protein
MSVSEAKQVKRKIPEFKSEDEERAFWAAHDAADLIDWEQARPARLPNLRPTTRTISIRLPESMIERLKMLANKRDVPYQSLLKIYVAERIEEELRAGQ